uniref:Uncharacterized protein n=1 Tax=Caenorhabditis elegans TaxID=6239 RepID=O45582_CAEEL|eukprot:NP_493104.1 Uncharacterized protein CELE_F56H6.3 [Caenorhabditis elegans]
MAIRSVSDLFFWKIQFFRSFISAFLEISHFKILLFRFSAFVPFSVVKLPVFCQIFSHNFQIFLTGSHEVAAKAPPPASAVAAPASRRHSRRMYSEVRNRERVGRFRTTTSPHYVAHTPSYSFHAKLRNPERVGRFK